ncbi:MAG: PQQ-binding-like beta-propeller repeat protein [Streptosporangiaceae bacterium]
MATAASRPTPTGSGSAHVARDWPAYLNGPLHTSYSPSQTAVTPATARNLVQAWHFAPNVDFLASPTVADGAVFIGSDQGEFYKLKEATGAVMDKRFIGHVPAKTCGARGTVATATVATDPRNHRLAVYVAGADGYLYALNASNLALKWKAVIGLPSATVSDYFDWSSPTVANGKIYIGVSSECDNPLVRGGVIAFNQASGKKLAELYTVLSGDVGGSVWSSVAVAPAGDVFVSTGNGPVTNQLLDYSESILKLAPTTLKVLGRFQVPAAQVGNDSDFGASPVIFGKYVGACNKDGIFYLLNQSNMKVRWERAIGVASNKTTGQCIATPAYNGKFLYFGGNQITIKGVTYPGSVQERNASDGNLLWETALPGGITGSPTLDGGGVLAVPTYYAGSPTTSNYVYLFKAASGGILRTLVQGTDFAQCVYADNWLFSANSDGVYAWRLK